MDNIRVGFCAFGYYGYPRDVIAGRGHAAAEAVRGLGYEVTETDPMTGVDDLKKGLAQLAGKAGGLHCPGVPAGDLCRREI